MGSKNTTTLFLYTEILEISIKDYKRTEERSISHHEKKEG